ncbi:MAG: hypothetical protein AAB354_14195 [candidate division KSB1 bacterium]
MLKDEILSCSSYPMARANMNFSQRAGLFDAELRLFSCKRHLPQMKSRLPFLGILCTAAADTRRPTPTPFQHCAEESFSASEPF